MNCRMQKIFGWGVREALQKFLFILICFGVFPVNSIFAKKILPVNDISKKVERSRGSVEDIYYELLKNHFFDDVNNSESIYANNLVLSTNLDEDPVAKGTILLNLIAWLEKKNNRDSRFLLHKINRLYQLEFHRTLSSLNPKYESYQDSLLSSFHDLSTYKTFHPAYGALYPFGTSITKAILTLFIINKTAIPFEQKRESVLYTIEKIKQEMLFVNSNLGKEKIDEGLIRSFVFGLEKFGVRETLVESKLFRNLLLLSTVAIVIGFIVYRWDLVGSGLGWVGTELKKLMDQAFDGFFEKAGKGLVKGMLEDETVVQLKTQMNTQVEQAKTEYNQIKERYLNDLEGIAGKAAENAVRGALRGAARVGANPGQQNPVDQPQDLAAVGDNNQPNQQPPVPPADNDAPAPNANNVNPDIQILIQEALTPIITEMRKGDAGRLLFGNGNQNADNRNSEVQALVREALAPVIEEVRQGVVGSLLLGDGRQRPWYNPARYVYGNAAPQNPQHQVDQQPEAEVGNQPAPTQSWFRGWFGGRKSNAQPPAADAHDDSDSDSDGSDSDDDE